MERVWSHHFPNLSLSVKNIYIYFFLILTRSFKFGCSSGYHGQLFDKNKFNYLMQNLILNRLASVCNLKNQEQKGWCAPFCFKINLIKFRFFIFFGQFRTAGNSTPGPPKAEKLAGSRKKKSSNYLKRNAF